MPAWVLRDGRSFEQECRDYEGFFTRPMPWEAIVDKFNRLAEKLSSQAQRDEIVATVRRLERARARDLTTLLGSVRAA